MWQRGLVRNIALCALIGGSAVLSLHAAGPSLKAGIGYEFLSQRYFLDSLGFEGQADSTLTIWSLRSTYLDDIKGVVSASWLPLPDQSLEVRASLEQTADCLRLKSGGDWRFRTRRSKIDVEGEMEWRNRFRDAAAFGDSYLYGRSRAKAAVPITNSLYGTGRLRLEAVDFRSSGITSFDYVRIGTNIGLEKTFRDYSWGEVSLLMATRQVPDSLRMNYTTWGIEGTFLGFLPTGDLDIVARFEYRDYNRPAREDDSRRLEVYGRNRVSMGRDWFAGQELDLEGMLYSNKAGLTGDYLRMGGALMTGIERGKLTLAAGPVCHFLWQRRNGMADDLGLNIEDYGEGGAKLDIAYIGVGLFASMESTTGYRTLQYESPGETSFWYERVYLLGDLELLGTLDLSVLFSAEWEWHREPQDNTALYLLSSGLTYSF